MNALQDVHPDERQLAALKVGKLEPPESVEIERHVATCDTCCEVLQTLPDDSLVNLLLEPNTGRVAPTEVVAPSNPAEAPTLAPQGADADDPTAIPPALAAHPRYRIFELLGTGGMGAVFKAQHQLMERVVALKVINRSLIDHPSAGERFRREVRAAARLCHPNIVTAYDAEQADDSHFLVMEYVEGTDLATLLAENGSLRIPQACDYARQAALGLQHAYERGMVHRDIKPHNLMLTASGQIKILDFGLARFASETAPAAALTSTETGERSVEATGKALTQIGAVMGTPDYIAPEQATDAHGADIRADIYSLGCTLYELLTGRVLFPGGNALDKVTAHLERQPQPLAELRRDVSPELVRVLSRLIAKNPADRYQTPDEVAQALLPFINLSGPPRRRRRWSVAARFILASGFAVAMSLLAAAVFYVKTDKGEFVIETDDENVAVMVNNQGVKIHDRKSDREYTLAVGENSVRTGEYLIDVSELPAGVAFSSQTFTLKRGGRVVVKASFRPPTSRPTGPAVVELRSEPLSWFPADATFFGGRDFMPEFAYEQILFASGLVHKAVDPTFQGMALRFIASVGRIDRVTFAYAADSRDPVKCRTWVRLSGAIRRDKLLEFLRKELGCDRTQEERGTKGERIILASSSIRGHAPAFAVIDETDLLIAGYVDPSLPHVDVIRQALEVRAGKAASVVDAHAKELKALPSDASGLMIGEHPEQWIGFMPFAQVLGNVVPQRVVGYAVKNPDFQIHIDLTMRSLDDAKKFAANIDSAKALALLALKNPPMLGPNRRAAQILGEALGGIKVAIQGDHIHVEAHLSSDTVEAWLETLKSNPLGSGSGQLELVKKIDPAARPLSLDGVQPQQGGWRIECAKPRTVRLYEIKDPGVDNCVIYYRAQLKSSLEGRAYLEMWCRFPDGEESFSKGLANPISGTTDWSSYQIPFRLEKGQRPDLIKLNLVIEGKGTVWIKYPEIWRGPLP
jgi:serine/threonine protein kinase